MTEYDATPASETSMQGPSRAGPGAAQAQDAAEEAALEVGSFLDNIFGCGDEHFEQSADAPAVEPGSGLGDPAGGPTAR